MHVQDPSDLHNTHSWVGIPEVGKPNDVHCRQQSVRSNLETSRSRDFFYYFESLGFPIKIFALKESHSWSQKSGPQKSLSLGLKILFLWAERYFQPKCSGGVKNGHFTVRLAVRGAGSAPSASALAVSKSENIDPFFSIMEYDSMKLKTHFISLWGVSKMHF